MFLIQTESETLFHMNVWLACSAAKQVAWVQSLDRVSLSESCGAMVSMQSCYTGDLGSIHTQSNIE